MINEKVLDFLKAKGYADRLTEHKETIDTVEHAAQQIGCSEAEIAKTLSFIVDEKPVIVVMAGDGRVNSSKFKALFHTSGSKCMTQYMKVYILQSTLFYALFELVAHSSRFNVLFCIAA